MDQVQEINDWKARILLQPLNSKEELRDWMQVFLDLKFPMGVVFPTSTHGPVEAMWRVYELFKTGESEHVPQVVMLSSRDSFKTLGAAALEVLCMLHFRFSLAHMAAITSQSEKAVQYVDSFFRKLKPYLEANGWKKNSENKKLMSWITDTGEEIYLKIVVATIAGANSEHVPLLCVDEVDVVQDPRALEEAKMIPSVYKQYHPLTVYLSTRKFAGGNMEKIIAETEKAGGEVLRWNILDVCARITKEEAQVHLPKVRRYISRQLPMSNISPEDFDQLSDTEKIKYEEFYAYAGISLHPLLSVMRNYLVDRDQSDVGNLYKPVSAVWNNFKKTTSDMGEAQLLCNKPSSSGLVYHSFQSHLNTITIDKAWEHLSGDEVKGKTLDQLIAYMHELGIEFYAGADWGSTDETAFTIFAKLASGHIWWVDLLSAPGLEIPDIVRYAKQLNEAYKLQKMYCDSAYPAYIKLVKAAGVPAVGVEKGPDSVINGIVSMQGRILSSDNKRLLKVLSHGNTDRVVEAFGTYKWKLDGKGDPIDGKPDHGKDGTADIMDSGRYCIYSMYGKGAGKVVFGYDLEDDIKRKAVSSNQSIIQTKIQELTGGVTTGEVAKVKKRGILWDM